MNKLISLAKGLFGKNVSSKSSMGKEIIKATISKIKLTVIGPIIVPVVLFFIMFFVMVSMFGEKLNLLQMVDPSSGNRRGNMVGTGIYDLSDFEDAVNVGDSSSKGGSYSDFVSSLNGSVFKDVNGFNEFIKSSVDKAGFGTREGVIAAAMALCYELPKETGTRFFYKYPGIRVGVEGITSDVYLDCRAFVQWAVYNGGFNADSLAYIGKDGVAKIATVKTDFRSAQPGDIFSTDSTGHIWLVVAVDDNGYYAAEEYSGAEINYYTWDMPWGTYYGSQGAKLYDMSAFYSNPDNVRSR